jgi:hypothetical protein
VKVRAQETLVLSPKTVVFDTREQEEVRKHRARAFENTDAHVVYRALAAGDYWIVGESEEVLIESKNLADLYSSFSNRRLDSEVAKMLNWAVARTASFPDKTIRVRLMIIGSYIVGEIQSRLLTYQRCGLEVIWGEDGAEMLVRQYTSVKRGKHTDPMVRQIKSCAKKMPLRDQVLAPVLNTRQRTYVFANSTDMTAFAHMVTGTANVVSTWPGFGPKTVAKLRESFAWGPMDVM